MRGVLRYAAIFVAIAAAASYFASRGGGPQTQRTAAPAAVAKVLPAPAHGAGARIAYAAGHYPELALPDGQREVVRSVLNVAKPMHFGDYVWNENGVPPGPVWIRVDLSRQILSVFRDGQEIGSAVILYGGDHHDTPTGSFTILAKNEHYYSHAYDAPMPYALRLTNDGVAIHGSNVREGWATHGCIGVPMDFARLLFAVTGKGDVVAIVPAETPEKQG